MIPSFDCAAEWLRPRLWYAKVAGVLVWGTWVISLALGTHQHDVIGQLVGMDHLAFYSPARMIRDGHSADIYDPVRLHEYQKSLLPPGTWENEYEAFRNPPFYALLYIPTAGLPYPISVYLWSVVSLASLIIGIHWLGPARPWTAAAWALTFLPVFSTISYGQNSLISLAVMCGTYRLLASEQRFTAGLVAGLLWFKPPLLLGLVVWGLVDVRRLWPCAVGVVVTGATLSLGTYPIVPDAWDAFVESLRTNVSFDGFDQWKMHNPRAFWRLLLPGLAPLPGILWVVSAVIGLALFLRIWWTNYDRVPVLFAASTLLMLWASPHTMVYEWSLAVIPAILVWTHLPDRRAAWVVLMTVAWVALFVSTDASRLQVRMQEWAEWPTIVVLQLSVPLLGWVGWQATCQWTACHTTGLNDPPKQFETESPATAP